MQIKFLETFLVILSVIFCDCETQVSKEANVCGNQKRSTGFIVRGSGFKHGEFPWMVALLYVKESPPAFFCGGTLVATSHVITAAHCIKPKYGESFVDQVFASDVLALFGAYNLSKNHESGRVSISPEEIVVHNDWNPHVERYDADIAVLTFAEGDIPITRYIKPICLLSVKASEQEGIVAGWGRSEDTSKLHENVPKKLTLPLHSNVDCFLETPDLAKLSSKRTFCAGLKNHSGVCLGDSGNGYYVKIRDIYFLGGIVSSSKTTESSCDVTKYAVYTNVFEFKSWISEIVGENVSVIENNGVPIEVTTTQIETIVRYIKDDTAAASEEDDEASKLKKQIHDAFSENSEVEKAVDASKQLGNDFVDIWIPKQSENVAEIAKKLSFW